MITPATSKSRSTQAAGSAVILIAGIAIVCAPAAHSRDAVALDLMNPNRQFDSSLKPYMIFVRKKIQKAWLPSSVSKALTTKVYFEITSTGELTNVSLSKSSGDSLFDKSTSAAIQGAVPFARTPQPEGLKVTATFNSRFVNLDDVVALQNTLLSNPKSIASASTNQQQLSPAQPPLSVHFEPSTTAPAQTYSGTPSYFPGQTSYAPATQQLQQNSYQSAVSMPLGSPAPIPYIMPRPTLGGSPTFGSQPTNHGQSIPGSTPTSTAPSYPMAGQPPVPSPLPSTGSFSGRPGLPTEWLISGRDGTHQIEKVSDDGYFLILNDGSVWKSENDGESDGWSSGDQVFVHNGTIINLSRDGKKVNADCEAFGCTILAETYVTGEFEGSDKPIVLDNGMIFEATTYHYHYAYRPEAVVLASRFAGHLLYKVIIGEEIYSATRLR